MLLLYLVLSDIVSRHIPVAWIPDHIDVAQSSFKSGNVVCECGAVVVSHVSVAAIGTIAEMM